MSENTCCGSTPSCDACLFEGAAGPSPIPDDATASFTAFDDAAITTNQVVDSFTFPAGGANAVRVTGVVINRTAAATIVFTVLVSGDNETWFSVGAFNVTTVGYFSSNSFSLNAPFVKLHMTTSSAATAVLAAFFGLIFK